MQAGAAIARALAHRVEQDAPVHSGHPVAAGRHRGALGADADGVPVSAVGVQGLPQDRIDGVDVLERRVGEHDSESEHVGFVIALEHVDAGVGHRMRQRDRGEQAAGPAADAGDAQWPGRRGMVPVLG